MFTEARKYALKKDGRNYIFGAIGLRSDGKIVFSRNIPNTEKNFHCHAEYRLSKKLDINSIVYVVRVSRKTGNLTLAKPCKHCENALYRAGVKKVYYSISELETGSILF